MIKRPRKSFSWLSVLDFSYLKNIVKSLCQCSQFSTCCTGKERKNFSEVKIGKIWFFILSFLKGSNQILGGLAQEAIIEGPCSLFFLNLIVFFLVICNILIFFLKKLRKFGGLPQEPHLNLMKNYVSLKVDTIRLGVL